MLINKYPGINPQNDVMAASDLANVPNSLELH